MKFQFNWFPKVQLEKTVYSLIAIFSFLVLLEGFTWKGDLTALKQKLFSSSGSLSYSEINTVVPNYRSFANSWTQRMLSILLFHSEGIPVKAIIKSSSPHETDMLDFGYKLFQQSFREYGGRYDIEFNFELIKPRGEWKKN
ncbi:MAG: hypothetical protein KC478_03830 [Bacteriovoracaceae bacterium]|nr:hypothetical protein [Bacteriovoracaceae bacterium]